MDGTLLNGDHKLTKPTIAKLRELAAKGVTIAIATGRSAPAVYAAIDELNLGVDVHAVTYNGGRVLRFFANQPASTNHETVFEKTLPADAQQAVIAFADRHELLLQQYIGEEHYVNPRNTQDFDSLAAYRKITGVRQMVLPGRTEGSPCTPLAVQQSAACRESPNQELITLESGSHSSLHGAGMRSVKMLLFCKTAVIDEVYTKAKEELSAHKVHIVRGSPPFFIEVLEESVCKGSGLEEMCKTLGVGCADVIAFGDGDNDVEFLRYAGMGVAMVNARDLVKNAADRVTRKPNTEDGVADMLAALQEEGCLPA